MLIQISLDRTSEVEFEIFRRCGLLVRKEVHRVTVVLTSISIIHHLLQHRVAGWCWMHSRSPRTAVVHTISASPGVCTHDEAVSVWHPRWLCSWKWCELHCVLLKRVAVRSLRRISLSVHFKWMQVSATGRKSFCILNEWLAFYSEFWISTEVVYSVTALFGCYMDGATWNQCYRLGAFCVHHTSTDQFTLLYACMHDDDVGLMPSDVAPAY